MRNSGTATNFTTPKRKTPSARMWVTILLCIVLPPAGLALLWRAVRCPVRGKILLSALSLVSMTFLLVFFIGRSVQDEALVPGPAAAPVYTQMDANPASVPVVTPPPEDGAPEDGGAVPANPMG